MKVYKNSFAPYEVFPCKLKGSMPIKFERVQLVKTATNLACRIY